MDGMTMNPKLPEAFVSRMKRQLGNELPAFLDSLEEESVRGIRLNTLKDTEAAVAYRNMPRIPWAPEAYELPADSDAGSTILHEAGAFYLQEPGAMLPASVLDAKPGETVLDLCAAPGGKSTQIGISMRGEGLLVCNEPVPKRARILSSNIERIGLPHAIVTCAWPEQLAEKWPEGFDAVMVDAPCSGEGMFRRVPESRTEWGEEQAKGCAQRQREILNAAAGLVRPGGRLVYSTCTYHPEENGGNAEWFLKEHTEYEPEAFSLPGIDAPEGQFTCYPHRLRTEGQFAARFRKKGSGEAILPEDRSMPKANRNETAVLADAFPSFPAATHKLGNTLVCLEQQLPDLEEIRVLRTGLHLGEVRGKIAFPDHAAAMCINPPAVFTLDLNGTDACRYMAGETIEAEAEGWILLRYKGLNLGWGKGSSGIIRNHYPKGLRNYHLIP